MAIPCLKMRGRVSTVCSIDLILFLNLIDQVESARDAVLKKAEPADEAERMIRSLTDLRSIGPDFATPLVRGAFIRQFRSRRALGGYVGLGGTPFSSGGSEREQGIGKDGNRQLRAAMVELAWMWLLWQPESALSVWLHVRVGAIGGRNERKRWLWSVCRTATRLLGKRHAWARRAWRGRPNGTGMRPGART
jgi:transposase